MRLGSQLSRVVEAVQVLAEVQDSTLPGRHHDPRGGQHSEPDATLRSRNRPVNNVRPLVFEEVRPLASPEDMAERALIERELSDAPNPWRIGWTVPQ